MIIRKMYGYVALLSGVICVILFSELLYVSYLDYRARNQDSGASLFSSGKCRHLLQYVDASRRTPTVGESFLIEMVFDNTTKKRCPIEISLYAAGFDKDPDEDMKVVLHRGVNTVRWSVSAKQAGSQEILISSGLEDRTIKFEILANHFFTQKQMEIITGLSAILGSAATLAWWLERREKSDVSRSQWKKSPEA